MLDSLYNIELFQIGTYTLLLGPIIICSFILLFFYYFNRLLKKYFFKPNAEDGKIEEQEGKRFYKIIRLIFLLFFILSIIILFKLNFDLISTDRYSFTMLMVIEGLLIIQFARLIDWIISNIFIHRNYIRRDMNLDKSEATSKLKSTESSATRAVQYIVYVLAAILVLKNFNLDPTLFETHYKGETFPFKLTNILKALLVLLAARLVVWALTQLILYGFYRTRKVDESIQFTLNKLLSYVIYVIAAIIALQNLGINMTVIWGGAAALLVGVGLGLQSTFNDFFSGIVLLFERTVKIGDVLDINGTVGTVKRIGLRSSLIETRDNTTQIIPNSKLVNNNVNNWTHYDNKVRFQIPIGVAYGSDTKLVKSLLIKAAKHNTYVMEHPSPFVRFEDFGDNALLFSLYFFSKNYMVIGDVKSDLRFEINNAFVEHGIQIPFPQLNIHLPNDKRG